MASVSGRTKREKYEFISRNRELGIKHLCEKFKVSRSGFYAWHTRKPSQHEKDDVFLARKIRRIYEQSKGTYGSPRIYHELKSQGIAIGKKRVERLMREMKLKGRVVKVTRRQPGLKRFHAKGENLLRHLPQIDNIDQVWVADITYLKVKGKYRYLTVIMDLYSRRILGWTLSRFRTSQITLKALMYATRNRKPPKGMIFHTDRGVEFTGKLFQRRLKKLGLKSSLNRPGHCHDNAFMESFFHSLKAELIRGRRFNSEKELRYALNSYINKFYNHKRLHSGIGYSPPAIFESMAVS